jgi:hypothetical protein
MLDKQTYYLYSKSLFILFFQKRHYFFSQIHLVPKGAAMAGLHGSGKNNQHPGA